MRFRSSLGDSGDDGEHGLPQRRAGVDLLAEGDELDAEVAEDVERLDKVAHRAADAVEGRDHHHVDLAGLHGREEPVEGRPPVADAGDPLIDKLDGLPAPSRDVFSEVAQLRLARLVGRAHAGIDGAERRSLRKWTRSRVQSIGPALPPRPYWVTGCSACLRQRTGALLSLRR